MKIVIAGDYFVENPENIIIGDDIISLMASCDFRVVNFEGPIDDGKEHYFRKSGPCLKQPSSTRNLLKQLGIDALTLANNHILDQGIEGFTFTKHVLYDFCLIGAGNWEEASRPLCFELGGTKIGLLNFSEMQFGMLYDKWTQGEDAIGCAWVNHPTVDELIRKTGAEVDVLIAIVHAGVEMMDMPLPEWRDRFRQMIDLGCDAVIAHHPHVVQGYEIYQEKPICYSLGNFCFPKLEREESSEWYRGALAVLDINKDNIELNFLGCKLQNGLLQLEDKEAWKRKTDELCSYLDKDNYMQRVNNSCERLMKDYWELFAMGGLLSPEAFSLKNIARLPLHKYDHVHLLNNLQCESHRWCISRVLRNKIGK